MIQELYLSNKESETMTNKKDNNTKEVEGEKVRKVRMLLFMSIRMERMKSKS